MEKPKRQESDNFTIRTSKTMREKAYVVGRCVINALKIWKVCCKSKKNDKQQPTS